MVSFRNFAFVSSYLHLKSFACIRWSTIFKTASVTKITKTVLKSSYRVLKEPLCLISCMIFEEKYFSNYIILTDQI